MRAAVVDEARIGGKLRRFQHDAAELHPAVVAQDQELQPAIRRLEDAARHGAPDLLALEVHHHHPDHLHRARRLQKAHLDAPPARLVTAGVERGGQGLEGIERRRHVDHDERHAMRDAVLALVVDHQTGEGLQHRVHRRPAGEWAGLAEARHRQIEDARLALAIRPRSRSRAGRARRGGSPRAARRRRRSGATGPPCRARDFRSSAIERLPRLVGIE